MARSPAFCVPLMDLEMEKRGGEMKRLLIESLLACLLLSSAACQVIDQAIEMEDLETAAKFVTKMNEAVDLMDEVGQTVFSDTEKLALPESIKEQVESAVEAGQVIEDFMPFADMAEDVIEEVMEAGGHIRTPTVASIATPTVLVGNEVTLVSVARRWEAVEGENAGASSTFRITKAGPWEQNDHFYVVVEFVDLEGGQTVLYGHYMSPGFKTEWLVDTEGIVDMPAPWCGTAVITVHDDFLSSDRLSEKYQVQVEVLAFCPCP